MRISNLEQGSEAWLEARKTKITSSDAAIINGTNTFRGNSPFKLWQQKLDLIEKEEATFIMKEGNLLEEEALQWFNEKYKTNYIKPNACYHDTEEWAMGSLDGYDEKSNYILEIKCGAATYDKATVGNIPSYYYDQIQHLLFVSGKKGCYYLAYRPDQRPTYLEVKRDEEYIKKLVEKEKEFYDFLVKLIPPSLVEKEFVEIRDASATSVALKWAEAKVILKNAEKMEKLAREALKDATDGGNCLFPDANVKVELRIRKGSIDYASVLKENGIDNQATEKYRKPELSWLHPTIIKQA